jgi:Arc/MetJ family transcription regulator
LRTTVDIPEETLKEVERITGEKSVSRAVRKALEDYIRHARIERLRASMGDWKLDLDDWYEFRHSERT